MEYKKDFDTDVMKIALCPDCKGKGFNYSEFGAKLKCYHCNGFGRVVRNKKLTDIPLSEFYDFDDENDSQIRIKIDPQEEASECPSA